MLFCFIFILYRILTGAIEQRPGKTNRFSASEEISPFYGKQIFNTAFTGASQLSLS